MRALCFALAVLFPLATANAAPFTVEQFDRECVGLLYDRDAVQDPADAAKWTPDLVRCFEAAVEASEVQCDAFTTREAAIAWRDYRKANAAERDFTKVARGALKPERLCG